MSLTGAIYFAVRNKAPISASAAEDSTYFIICEIVKIGPFQQVICSFSDRNIWAPALLLDFVSLLKHASECAVIIISLERYTMSSSGYLSQKSNRWLIAFRIFSVAEDFCASIALRDTSNLLFPALA